MKRDNAHKLVVCSIFCNVARSVTYALKMSSFMPSLIRFFTDGSVVKTSFAVREWARIVIDGASPSVDDYHPVYFIDV